MKNVPVLYEDENCFVFNKPAGLAVQGGAGVGVSLDSLLAASYGPEGAYLVHRLDKDTSGAILVARSREAAAALSTLIAGRQALKRYLAVCALPSGALPPAGLIDSDLDRHGRLQRALTRYRRLAMGSEGAVHYAVLELELGTGRMHQCRRHLALKSAPILGDDKYGDFALNKRLRKSGLVRKLLLHSWRLVLPPSTGFPLDVISPPPAYFAPFWKEEAPAVTLSP